MTYAAHDFAPDAVAPSTGHYIGGTYRAADEASIEVTRPSDGRVYGAVPEAGEAGVDAAVASAVTAASESGWARCAPRDRARVMRRWADLIDTDQRLTEIECVGSTRPIGQACAQDIPFTAEAIRFFAEYADKDGGDLTATRADSLGFVAAEPFGVIGAITPWNFPLSMASWKCGPALAAGNAMVIKPSELTPFSTLRMAELAVEAGIPAGIFNVVQGTGATTGAALVRHPDVGKISFTGSNATGQRIMADAGGAGVKPVTLELGGKSPQLVFADVPDFEHVAQCVVRGFTANGGQACISGTRLIVHERLAQPLVERIVEIVSKMKPGPTWAATTDYCPIIGRAQADKIETLVAQAKQAGAEVLTGGSRFADGPGGLFYRPTVLANVTDDMAVVAHEVFGPVLTVQTFRDEAEGIARADHPHYGLAAGVHTRDIGQAMRAMRGIQAGTIWINRYGRSRDLAIPTGGYKGSGIGKDLGRQAFEACQRYKSVLMDFEA
ncbi:aldehyde dehydrogenase [Salinisphaera sp. Q1T1-3]|uniref:aldehyde dehydrogenase family protein n=1 Tax=Salinisphaera sp. Q1T1-3 TaxID=2321229 RepID=UPI000E773177|nr:aldehyde dehydrogenase family protein [Salinisphaera sp. Q1T1-3]RJS91843.1 aldehyde dehydrogenase [Salinisphaera sp. Q1T1-3]